jgi:hypothetical protein
MKSSGLVSRGIPIRTWVQGRVNNFLGRPQIRGHGGDFVLLVGRDQGLGLFQTRG